MTTSMGSAVRPGSKARSNSKVSTSRVRKMDEVAMNGQMAVFMKAISSTASFKVKVSFWLVLHILRFSNPSYKYPSDEKH